MHIDLDPSGKELPWSCVTAASTALRERVIPALGPQLAAPHRLFRADFGDDPKGKNLDLNWLGWRYLVMDRDQVVATIDVDGDYTRESRVLGTKVGGAITQIDEIIAYAEKKLKPPQGIYELRCLQFAGSGIELLWFHFKFDKDDPDGDSKEYHDCGVILDGKFPADAGRDKLLRPFDDVIAELRAELTRPYSVVADEPARKPKAANPAKSPKKDKPAKSPK